MLMPLGTHPKDDDRADVGTQPYRLSGHQRRAGGMIQR